MALPAGTLLGLYKILAPLGAGGMGEVYKALDTRLERTVAVKVLPASFSQDAERLRRFAQEAKAPGLLNHPNVTAVYNIGTHAGAPYVVQEFLEGETFRTRLAKGRWRHAAPSSFSSRSFKWSAPGAAHVLVDH
jgi:eukaryotic-like serine/threonine-protein kinase